MLTEATEHENWSQLFKNLTADEHAWLLPSKITPITLVYSSCKLIQAPAVIITPL